MIKFRKVITFNVAMLVLIVLTYLAWHPPGELKKESELPLSPPPLTPDIIPGHEGITGLKTLVTTEIQLAPPTSVLQPNEMLHQTLTQQYYWINQTLRFQMRFLLYRY